MLVENKHKNKKEIIFPAEQFECQDGKSTLHFTPERSRRNEGEKAVAS